MRAVRLVSSAGGEVGLSVSVRRAVVSPLADAPARAAESRRALESRPVESRRVESLRVESPRAVLSREAELPVRRLSLVCVVSVAA